MTSHEPLQPHTSSQQPPTRLRESPQKVQTPSARWALSLLRQARPYQPVPARQERVWANLLMIERGSRASRLRLAFAAALWLVAGLFASAALAQWPAWLAQAIHAVPMQDGPDPVAKRPTATHEQAAPPQPVQTVAVPSAPVPETPAAVNGPAPARRSPRLATPEESELLLNAMRALRVEHNPERARTILSSYLAHHPKGALAEEALVMLVEAAAARGDRDAAALGARYFAQYPKGGFADQVRRALAGSPAPAPPSR